MDNNSLSHTKYNCKYHTVFAPKFRRKSIYIVKEEKRKDIKATLPVERRYNYRSAYLSRLSHLFVEIQPKMSVSSFVGYLKGKNGLMIFERFLNLNYKYCNRNIL